MFYSLCMYTKIQHVCRIFGWKVVTENVITENVMYYIFGWYNIFGCDTRAINLFFCSFLR